jgi:hypothetical protein
MREDLSTCRLVGVSPGSRDSRDFVGQGFFKTPDPFVVLLEKMVV